MDAEHEQVRWKERFGPAMRCEAGEHEWGSGQHVRCVRCGAKPEGLVELDSWFKECAEKRPAELAQRALDEGDRLSGPQGHAGAKVGSS